ncbi:MAG: glycosyltransferase family 4 protein [Candidatus Kapabacteria bacterium]|nr:glycosyltransferase family 4 protein [Candidatus Kapabacteria bacterium]
MKILVINWQCIKNPLGGGAEVHLHEIFKRVAALGHEVTLFCCEVEGLPKEEIIDGLRTIRHGSRSLFNFHVPLMYWKRFSHENFDIIVDDINKIPFYTPLFVRKPLLAISHHFFGKSIYREANFIAGTYVYLCEKLIDFIYKKTPFAVVSQSTLEEFLERGFDSSHFSIVPNAIHQAEYPMEIDQKEEFPVISYFGRLKKYKSVDHLFYAFARVKEKFPDAMLHILGRGDFRPFLEELSIKLGIERSVVFFGFVSDEDKVRLLSKVHCMVNTSMKEGWGITNIEANACGTPVISANVPGLRDSVNEGQSGLLYKYGDINDLTDKLLSLLSNKDLQNHLNHGSIEWASQFSWQTSAELMVKTMEKALMSYEL